MTGMFEREIVPPVRNFLITTAQNVIGPRLRNAYEQNLEAHQQRLNSPLIVTAKNNKTFEITTSADRTLDDMVRNLWQKAFPDIPWYSEDSKDRRVKGLRPDQLRQLPVVVVVDMVDGSGRLARQSDRFSSSLALVIRDQTVLAVIIEPVSNTLWVAERGKGTYRNDQLVYVSDTADLKKAMVSTAFAWDRRQRKKNDRVLIRISPFVNQIVGTASSVLDILDVAQGKTDAHASIGLKPWDKAGAAFAVFEAGGKDTTITGGERTVFDSDSSIVVDNSIIHDDLVRIINRNTIKNWIIRAYQIQVRPDISKSRGDIFVPLRRAHERIVFLAQHARLRK